MMKKPSITSTNHILPFGELSPSQFERLCLWLVKSEGYLRAEHLGEAGSDKGRDVIAYRVTEEGAEQLWYFQCKRHQKLSTAKLEEEVEKYNKLVAQDPTKKPFGIVFVISSTLAADARENIRRFCTQYNYAVEFWARTELDFLVKKYDPIVREFFNPNTLPSSEPRNMSEQDMFASQSAVDDLVNVIPPSPFYAHWHYLHGTFVGRIQRRNELTRWYESGGHPLKVIVALGGFGKSSLAWIWMKHDMLGEPVVELENDSDRSPTGEIAALSPDMRPEAPMWWSFYAPESGGKTSFFQFLSSAAKYFAGGESAVIPTSLRGQLRFLLNALEKRRTLLVLDGFERELRLYAGHNAAYQGDVSLENNPDNNSRSCYLDLAKDFLRGLCRLNPGRARVLITSRLFPHPIDDDRQRTEIELQGLDLKEALMFLRTRGVKGAESSLRDLCSWCGYHPLALRLAISIIERDYEHPNDIKAITNSDATKVLREKLINDANESGRGRHIFEYVYNKLSTQQQWVHSRIACFRNPVSYTTLRDCLGYAEDKETFKEIISELIDLGLLTFDRHSKLCDMHPIVRQYSYERLPEHDRQEYHKHLFGFLYDGNKKAATEERELWPLLDLFWHALNGGELKAAKDLFLASIFGLLHYRLGYYSLEVRVLTELLEQHHTDHGRLPDEDAGYVKLKLSVAQTLSGEAKSALNNSQDAIDILGRVPGQEKFHPMRLSNFAFCLIPLGRLTEADRNLKECKRLFREDGLHFYEAIANINHGLLWLYCGQNTAAEKEFKRALKFFDKQNFTHQSLLIWLYRAWGALLAGNLDQCAHAVGEVKRLLPACRHRNDNVRAAWIEAALLVHQVKNNTDTASKDVRLERAQNLLNQAFSYDSVELAKDLLLNLYQTQSMWYRASGDVPSAIDEAQRMLEEAQKGGYKLREAEALLLLAELGFENDSGLNIVELATRAAETAVCDGGKFSYLRVLDEANNLLEQCKGSQKTCVEPDVPINS